ncbi:SRPBCC family protein [Dyadobacter fermentans]|uniref:Activator of HSP90 ATPase 1 family protein n=1 Tax=Dyadobacter fermentans (strain ATCC 700827 / DSM 18053 / CIP 107007 / KCTC 52180 / NS114) TaxID=471854 RepID=C6VZF6_DYAFD|nr:SRPBCC domain-containing protein [Dyadobacter fermentans]ACT91768.1 activator of HSP90 ATPase 1 family protein [Dyadobacter fermentans DSM 18053]
MSRKLVQKDIHIQASAEQIWRIITEDEHNVKWLAAFGEGNIAQTDWQEGSKARFTDDSNVGLIAVIRESRPFEKILIQNIGILTDGKEDYDSDEAIESQEFFEQYLLTPEDNGVRMQVQVNVEDEFYDEISDCWERALGIMKGQAEGG